MFRYVANELATDITVTVGDTKFYLHKVCIFSSFRNIFTYGQAFSECSAITRMYSIIPNIPSKFMPLCDPLSTISNNC